MVNLNQIPIEDLQIALRDIGHRPTLRLTAAIAYKSGVNQQEIASWYDIERKTVYNWLKRFENRPETLAEAAENTSPPGRPRKLTDTQLERLYQDLQNDPSESGLNDPKWNPQIVQKYILNKWSVRYSLRSCSRFIKEANEIGD